MNDRFSAQLRQHLIETANERPAEGQLAAVVEQVAVTPQRPSLVARLTWIPGRIGPLPAAPVRYGLVGVALLLAAMAGAILAGGGADRAPSTVFEGTWTSTDPADGSVMILAVGSGNTPAVYFEDGYASGAACVNDPVKRFTARGTGTITGDRLVASFPDGGGCGLVTVGVPGDYEYRPTTDVLVDQDGVIWTRVLSRGQAPATQTPATQAPQTQAPETQAVAPQSPEAIEFPPLTTTFVSPTNGYSARHPEGRGFTLATELWVPEARDAGTPSPSRAGPHPAFDYDETGYRATFMGASTEIPDGVSIDEWVDGVVVEHAGGCVVPRNQQAEIVIDGRSGRISECGVDIVATVVADGRLYLFSLFSSLAGDQARAIFDAFVATIELRPEDAVAGS